MDRMTTVEQQSRKVEKEQGKIIPKEAIKAFAKGLRRSIFEPLEKISLALNELANDPEVKEDVKIQMALSFEEIKNLLDRLEKDKEVRVVTKNKGPDFTFSNEDEEFKLKPGPVIMDNKITPDFLISFYHRAQNSLQFFSIFEIIEMHVQQESARRNASSIHTAQLQINETIERMRGSQEIKMLVDQKGDVDIPALKTPVPAQN